MAAAPHHPPEELPEKRFRKQLAAAVRSIQWSYAIFWSASANQQGALSWTDGCYNGDIKTRKMTQPMELKAEEMGLCRSEQLRELYESLSSGDSNHLAKRPPALLSPEDLTDAEWYYLVCMSFTFASGCGLPGRALACNHLIWISNAQFADSKAFSRSLVAKSASIQTVVCVPFMAGVLELGTIEQVQEDHSLIQHITTSFWELPFPVFCEQSVSSPPTANREEDNAHQMLDHGMIDATDPLDHFALDIDVPSKVSGEIPNKLIQLGANSYEDISQQIIDDFGTEGLNGITQVHNTVLIDGDFTNGFHGSSLHSSDCMSRSFLPPQGIPSSPRAQISTSHGFETSQERNHFECDASHYTKTLAAILRNSEQSTRVPGFLNVSQRSSFGICRRVLNGSKPFAVAPQKLLKKVLVESEYMHSDHQRHLQEHNGQQYKTWKSGIDAGLSHVLSERRRREKLNEKFLILRSLIPSIGKVDKASILSDTIEYVKELEQRAEELESRRQLLESGLGGRRKCPDIAERTSDNYCNKKITNGRKKNCAVKRKVSDANSGEAEHWIFSKDCQSDVHVTMNEKEVLLKMQCQWRDFLLLDIFDVISNLHLDPLFVLSSTADGVLQLTLKAKFTNSVMASPGMIKQTLQRVAGRC